MFLVLLCHRGSNPFQTDRKGGSNMFSNLTTRRGFAARLAALLPSFGFAGAAGASPAPAGQGQGGVQKLDANGKPSDGKGFITPLIIHNGLVYIAVRGAQSRGDKSDEAQTPTMAR